MAEAADRTVAQAGCGMTGDYRVEPLSIAEVMAMTGRSRRTIERWIKDGHLRSVDLGGFDGAVVDRSEVARYEKKMRDNLRKNQATTAIEDPDAAT